MVGWYPGRAPKVENLNKFLLGVSSSSPHPCCASLSLERLDLYGEKHGHWGQALGFESQFPHLLAVWELARF